MNPPPPPHDDDVPNQTPPLPVREEAAGKEEAAAAAGTTNVTLNVLMQHKPDMSFRIKRNAPLIKLMNAYCERLQLDPKVVKFTYDGVKIGKDQTADEREMEDGDVIDVWSEQLGGAFAPITSVIF